MDRNTVAAADLSSSPADDLETIVNEIVAEQAVFRITLQCLLLTFFATRREMGPQALAELKAAVSRSIDHIHADPGDEGGLRWKQLASSRAEQMFLELDDAMERTLKESGRSGPH